MSSNTVPLFSFSLSYVVPPCKLNINKLSLTFYFHLDDKLKHAQTHPYTNPSNTRDARWVQQNSLPLYYCCCWVQINERQSLNRCSLKIKSSRSYPFQVQVWLKFSKFSWVRLFCKKGLMLHITKVSIFKVLCSNDDQQDRK